MEGSVFQGGDEKKRRREEERRSNREEEKQRRNDEAKRRDTEENKTKSTTHLWLSNNTDMLLRNRWSQNSFFNPLLFIPLEITFPYTLFRLGDTPGWKTFSWTLLYRLMFSKNRILRCLERNILRMASFWSLFLFGEMNFVSKLAGMLVFNVFSNCLIPRAVQVQSLCGQG